MYTQTPEVRFYCSHLLTYNTLRDLWTSAIRCGHRDEATRLLRNSHYDDDLVSCKIIKLIFKGLVSYCSNPISSLRFVADLLYNLLYNKMNKSTTRWKVLSWEYRSPRKRNSRPPASVILCWVSWVDNVYLLCVKWFVGLFTLEKIPGLRCFWTLAIVTENELGLAFPLETFPKNFVQIRPRFI